MGRRYLIILGASIGLITFGLLVLTFDRLDPMQFPQRASEMVPIAQDQASLLSPAEWKQMQASRAFRLIDLRDQGAFQKGRIESAENIPLERILDPEFEALWRENSHKLLISEDGRTANQAWVLLKQFGYENLYVLEGGMNSWEMGMQGTNFQDEVPQLDFAAKMKE